MQPAGIPEQGRLNGRRLAFGVAALDMAIMVGSLALAWPLRSLIPNLARVDDGGHLLALRLAPLLLGVWMLVMLVDRAYDVQRLGGGSEEFRTVARASASAGLATATICFLGNIPLARGFILAGIGVGAPALAVQRYLVRRWLARRREAGQLCQRVVLVGTAKEVGDLAAVLARFPRLGYNIVAVTVTDPIGSTGATLPAPALGSPHNLATTCARVAADTVMVAGGAALDLRKMTWELEGSGVNLIVTPRLNDVSAARLHMRPVAGLPMLHVEEPQASRSRRWPKRAFDVALSLTALVILCPLMIVVSAVIKLTDGGPVFFRQMRVGLDGVPFGVWKFRSMSVDAEAIDAELRRQHGYSSGLFKLQDDPRVTRFGGFIRRFSIDELPQLFNVLGGSMSLVGPRPFVQVEVDTFTEEARRRLHVRPGMTGLWQVSGRSNLSASEAVRLDLYYRDNWSLVTDLFIMGKTVKAVIARDGAY